MPHARPVLRFIFSGVRDLLFPPRCVTCGELLPPCSAGALCPACRTVWDGARLAAADAAARSAVAGYVYLVDYRAGNTDGVPERLIFHLKHKGDTRAFAHVAKELSMGTRVALLAAEKNRREAGCRPDGGAIVDEPPLYTYPPRRRAAVNRDGFDQAARLARALAREMGGDFAGLFRRTVWPTAEQKALDAEARTRNAARAFLLRKRASERIRGRVIVLCDDLSTTGATLQACEARLLAAGAAAVVRVTVGQTAVACQTEERA